MRTSWADSTDVVLNALLNPQGPPRDFSLDWCQISELYDKIGRRVGNSRLVILGSGEEMCVQFSGLRQHRIRVVDF